MEGFMESFSKWLGIVNGYAWGWPMIVLLVGTGIYLTIRLRFLQLFYIRHSIRCISGKFDNPQEAGDITHFQALCAALSATIGTGNIAGVATAIAIGGPGAVFWMWVTALIGMATKYTSCSLAVRYRKINPDGSASGGPMYVLAQGAGLPWLGTLFALFAGLASFGIGCAVQSNSVIDGIKAVFPQLPWANAPAGAPPVTLPFGIPPTIPKEFPLIGNSSILAILCGLILAVMVGLVIIGGIKRIAKVASRIVPFMSVAYVLAALLILILNAAALPAALLQIFQYAFTPFAVGGGLIGATIRIGVARGVFSNESGLGSAPMAHAAAKTSEMAREGFVAMLGPFIDTIIICSMTALVILTSGAWQVRANDGELLYGIGGSGEMVEIKEWIAKDDSKHYIITPEGDDRATTVPQTYIQVMKIDGETTLTVTKALKAMRKTDQLGNATAPAMYYEWPTGAALTSAAFTKGLGRAGGWVVAFGLVFFAFSTMIAWSYYGDRSWEYLLGSWAVLPYRILFCVFVVIGAMAGLNLVWTIADTLNAFMAVPNLIALILLAGLVAHETRDYIRRMRDSGDL